MKVDFIWFSVYQSSPSECNECLAYQVRCRPSSGCDVTAFKRIVMAKLMVDVFLILETHKNSEGYFPSV
jgi:hypothetical protein